MDTIEAIQNRRAVKHFDPNHALTEEQIQQLLANTLLSPTAFNIQHWRFILVRDSALRQQIRQAAWNQAQVTDASLLVIVCADIQAWQKQPERYWRNADQAVQDFLLPAIHQYYADKPQVQRDDAIRSCGIAAQTLMLAAKNLGYDSCPMSGFDYHAVGELIHLPSDHLISMMIAIGKAVSPANPRGGQLEYSEVVFDNRFA